MTHAEFDETKFREQFANDLGWFNALELKPVCYTGGWWILNRTILAALNDAGILYDFTLRTSLRNSFGESYDLPLPHGWNGTAIKFGSHLWEVGSYASLWRYPLGIASVAKTRIVGLHFHDYDIMTTTHALRRTVRALARLSKVHWVSMDQAVPFNLM